MTTAGRPGRPLGATVQWRPRPSPSREPLVGSEVLLRPLEASADAEPLYAATHPAGDEDAIWAYLSHGPYDDAADFARMLAELAPSLDPLFFAVVRRADELPVGLASYLRIDEQSGVVEIGNLVFGTPLQRTTAATEAIFLLLRRAFEELGYRRVEWKCNALNGPSRRAAERFGFTYEGIFRRHQVVKGRNRDTAWYAIIDEDWPAIHAGFRRWLRAENFDARGRQLEPLAACIADAREPSAGHPGRPA